MWQVAEISPKHKNMGIDPCIGATAATKACSPAPKHRKIADFDSKCCLRKMWSSSLETFAGPRSTEYSSIVNTEVLQIVARTYVENNGNGKCFCAKYECSSARSLPTMELFPAHISQFISQHYCNMEFFEKSRHNFCTMSSHLGKLLLNAFDVKTFHEHECGSSHVVINNSTATYKRVGEGWFAAQRLERGYWCGTAAALFYTETRTAIVPLSFTEKISWL